MPHGSRLLHYRQLAHRTVRTQDFPDFWVLCGLRANRKVSLSTEDSRASHSLIKYGLLDSSIRIASPRGRPTRSVRTTSSVAVVLHNESRASLPRYIRPGPLYKY